jgi:predicted nucleic acid-binding protein
MNIVDSSGWLEYLSDGTQAKLFSPVLSRTDELLVPIITIYEVFKVVLRERGEDDALQVLALMKQGRIVELSTEIAIYAARISHEKKIPMADSIIIATAYYYNAVIWTQDKHFKNLKGVKYFARK